jgi:hypothetical protein
MDEKPAENETAQPTISISHNALGRVTMRDSHLQAEWVMPIPVAEAIGRALIKHAKRARRQRLRVVQ